MLTGIDEATGRRFLRSLQVLIKQLTGADQLADRYPLQCFCLENPRDGGAWWAAVYGVTQSRTRLSDFHFQ